MDSSVVKHLLSTMQGPGFDPQHHRKTTEKNMPGMVAQTCNLSTQETKAGVLSASLKFHVVKRKKKKRKISKLHFSPFRVCLFVYFGSVVHC